MRPILLALFTCIMFIVGCVDSGSDSESVSGSGSFSREKARFDVEINRTLTALANHVFVVNHSSFLEQVQVLEGAVDQYCSDLGSSSESSSRFSAQSAWQAAIAIWQRILAAQFGPATENGDLLSGRIYSWPDQVSTCTLDRHIVLGQEADYDITSGPRQARGLDALEYLLYNTNLAHTCSSFIPETQSWNALTESERQVQRCAFARLAVEDLVSNADSLNRAWQSYQINFSQAGSEESDFDSATTALNEVTDALFYLDTIVKDRKLAAVLGLNNTRGSCSNTTCVELRESPWSEVSLQAIQNNLLGFKQVFIASLSAQNNNVFEQVGFDYQLAIRNFPDLSQVIISQVDEAIALIDGLDQTLNAYVTDIEDAGLSAACVNASTNVAVSAGLEVCALHGMVKLITDKLKTDFLTLMTLSLPERVEGDND